MEIKNKLTVTRGGWGGIQWGRKGEGASKGTQIVDSWAWTKSGSGIDGESWGDGVGVSHVEKGRTSVTEQQ